jgi:hypothetical protein
MPNRLSREGGGAIMHDNTMNKRSQIYRKLKYLSQNVSLHNNDIRGLI